MLRQSTGLETSAGGLKRTTGMNLEIRNGKRMAARIKCGPSPGQDHVLAPALGLGLFLLHTATIEGRNYREEI